LFVNEPARPTDKTNIGTVNLRYDIGSYIVKNVDELNFYIGTDLEGKFRFYGWIQEVKIFLISLVNLEISNLFANQMPNQIKIQSECRCPNEFPRNENLNSIFCGTNQLVSLSFISKMSRLNEYAHPLGFLNDEDFTTSWISCILTITNSIILELDLENGIYIIERIEIYFSSLPPTSLVIQRWFKNRWTELQSYSIDCNTTSCIRLPAYEEIIFHSIQFVYKFHYFFLFCFKIIQL
jgi:hypothetical protein